MTSLDPLTPGGPMTADADTPDTDPAALGAAAVDAARTEALQAVEELVRNRLSFVMMNGESDADDAQCDAFEAVLDDLERVAAQFAALARQEADRRG